MSRAFLGIAVAIAIAPSIARAEQANVASSSTSSEATVARLEIDRTLAGMRGRAKHVRDLLREARKRGETKRATCLDEALSRCDVATRHAREIGDEVLAAYARNDLDAARGGRQHIIEEELAQIVARRDANACFPPPVATRDTTTLKVNVDPRLPPGP